MGLVKGAAAKIFHGVEKFFHSVEKSEIKFP